MDAVYNRPFLQPGKLPVAIGGYMEANTQYAVTDGITDGFSFQFRRTNLFFSSTIAKKIKFFGGRAVGLPKKGRTGAKEKQEGDTLHKSLVKQVKE